MNFIPLTADKYPVEELPPGWATAEVTFRHADGKLTHRYEILDVRFKDEHRTRYAHEPMNMIAFKCFGLFLLGLPIYFLIYTAFQFVRTPIVSVLNLSPTAFLKQIWAIARIPMYFIGLEYAAFYGIFNPLEGRAFFAMLERAFHDGKGLHESVQYQQDMTFKELCWSSLKEPNYRSAFFAGVCMQPIGKTNDPHIIAVKPVQKGPENQVPPVA